MCGICGIAGPGISVYDLDVLKDLAFFSSLRGTDSTGVFQGKSKGGFYSKEAEVTTKKSLLDSPSFLRILKHTKNEKRILEGVTNDFFCVHTRHATRGELTEENAHPFEFDKIVGVHNGTLFDKRYHDNSKTDSELFIKDINDNGVVPILRKLSLASAYAIVLFDKETSELVFARNDQRSLYVCFNKIRSVMYWASEKWMLEIAMERNKEKILDDKVNYFEPNFVYRVNPREITSGTTAQFRREKFQNKPLVDATQFKNWQNPNINNWKQRQEEKKRNTTSEKRRGNHLVVVKNSTEQTPSLSETFSSKIPLKYCCACHQPMSLVDQYFAEKFSKNAYIHEDCMKNIPFLLDEEVKVG